MTCPAPSVPARPVNGANPGAPLYLRETDAFRAVAMHNTPPVYSEKRGDDGSWQIRQSDGDGSQGAGRWLKRHYRAPNMRWKTSV
jgi:hypothetical protein